MGYRSAIVKLCALASCSTPGAPAPRPPAAAASARSDGEPSRVAPLTEAKVVDVRDNDGRLGGYSTYQRAIAVYTSRLGPPTSKTVRRVRHWWYAPTGDSHCKKVILVQSPGDRAVLGANVDHGGMACEKAKLSVEKVEAAKGLLATSPAPRFGDASAAWEAMLGPPAGEDEVELIEWRYVDPAGACKVLLVWSQPENGWDDVLDRSCD